MGRAQGRVGDAAADADDRHRQVVIAQIDADELVRPEQGEGRDRVGERAQPAQRHAGAHADHDLLGDAGVDKAVGELFAEAGDRARRRDVGDDDRQPRIGLAELVKGVGKDVSHAAFPSISAIA